MTYTRTYLDTAHDMTQIFSSLASYQRDRLLAASATRPECYNNLLDDRLAITKLCSDVGIAQEALIKLYDDYANIEYSVTNSCLSLTPAEVRNAVSGISTLRRIATSVAGTADYWAQADDLTSDEQFEQHLIAEEMYGWDSYLYSHAVDANDAFLRPVFTEVEESNV